MSEDQGLTHETRNLSECANRSGSAVITMGFRSRMAILVAACLWLPSAVAAQNQLVSDRPEAVESERARSTHKFLDLQGKIANGAHLSLATLDAVGTCRTLAAGGVEHSLPTQHCGPASAFIAGGVAFNIGIAYIFHRTGHHKLERIMEIAGAADSLYGVAYTTTHGGRW